MSKLKLAVLFGGVSSEHSISLLSATTVIQYLNKERYELELIGITKTGRFLRYTGDVEKIKTGEWEQGPVQDCVISPSRAHRGLLLLDGKGGYEVLPIDCVVPVLHGKNGEDGTIQGLFQLAGIPFVGCDAISSANCMDKEMTHIILGSAGVRMAKWAAVRSWEDLDSAVKRLEETLGGYPMFIKPANAGSSIGVSKAHDRGELVNGLKLAFDNDYKAIVEETIIGREIECAVLGNEDAKASLPGEIEPANEFYDFEAKYENAESKLHIPARIPEDTVAALRKTAVHAYQAIGCAGLSRVDFFVTDENEVILNEINTLPGFTNISMYPKMWEKTGIPITELLDRLIDYAMKRTV